MHIAALRFGVRRTPRDDVNLLGIGRCVGSNRNCAILLSMAFSGMGISFQTMVLFLMMMSRGGVHTTLDIIDVSSILHMLLGRSKTSISATGYNDTTWQTPKAASTMSPMNSTFRDSIRSHLVAVKANVRNQVA